MFLACLLARFANPTLFLYYDSAVVNLLMNKETIKNHIAEYAEKADFPNAVKKISLFGSYLNGIPRRDSDVDLLVDFTRPVGFFDFVRIQEKFGAVLGRKVDLATSRSLSKHFRDAVLREAEIIYER